jgi:hypothetical protein
MKHHYIWLEQKWKAMNNKTYGDLMSEYEKAKEIAHRFGDTSALDKFTESLIQQIAPKPKVEDPLYKFKEYTFDDIYHTFHSKKEDL